LLCDVWVAFLYDAAPLRVYWELTRACDLACKHCRADAMPSPHHDELTTVEAFRVLDDLAGASPHVILTGGDPLKRADFFDIVERTIGLGLPCLVAPSATPLLTREVIRTLAAMRIEAMSLSIDGATAARHDAVRGISGTFARTVAAAQDIIGSRIPLQINTLVASETVGDLPAIHQLVSDLGADRWSLFFLISTGRGQALTSITAEESERVLNWALDHASDAKPIVMTTEAPHYRRIAVTRFAARIEHSPSSRIIRRGLGVRDGNGVMFISHTGDVQPSGFLPLTAGNVRTASPLQIYRDSPLFRSLRRSDGFAGRCGHCEFREICGGSRARAFAATGNPLESDPLCVYQPPSTDRARTTRHEMRA
jgi:AdoMet-dependent heme synthase